MYNLTCIMKTLGYNQIRITYDVNNKIVTMCLRKITIFGKTCFDVSRLTIENGEVEIEFIDTIESSAVESIYRNIKAKHNNVSITFK